MEFSHTNNIKKQRQVRKNTKRYCVDFRQLDKISKPILVPLSRIDGVLTILNESTYFTFLDLRAGYWEVVMDPSDKKMTAFVCHESLFKFNVMSFGLMDAPGIFQE